MPRPRNPIPHARFNLVLPRETNDRIDLLLWSETERRVPVGVKGAFISRVLNDYLRGTRVLKPESPLEPIHDALLSIRELARSPIAAEPVTISRMIDACETAIELIEDRQDAAKLIDVQRRNPDPFARVAR